MNKNFSFEDLLLPLKGESLVSVSAQFHCLDGELSNEAIAFFFVFSNKYSIKVSCSADGESIDAEHCLPYSYSMQSVGEVVLVDKGEFFADFSVIDSLGVVFDNDVKKNIGLFFVSLDKKLFVLNVGDVLVVSHDLPDFILKDAVLIGF